MKNSEGQEIKVILVGQSGTGKTSLINSAIGQQFIEGKEQSTISSSFVTKIINIDEKSYTINLWDTIGQEKFRSLTKIFIKDSKIVILVYDITVLNSFEELKFWYDTIKEVLGDTAVLGVAGNKQDLFANEQVNEEVAKKYANDINALFKLTSAKNPLNFNKLLEDLLREYIKKTGGVIESNDRKKLDNKKDGKSGKGGKCCSK